MMLWTTKKNKIQKMVNKMITVCKIKSIAIRAKI